MLDKLQSRKKNFLSFFWRKYLTIPLKTPQKSRLFWDVSERSLRCLSQWTSDWDLSETSHVGWVNLRKLSFVDLTLWIVTFLGENPFIWEYVQVLFDSQDFLIWNKKERDPPWMDYGNCSSYKWTSFYEKDLRKKQLHFMLLFQWQYC